LCAALALGAELALLALRSRCSPSALALRSRYTNPRSRQRIDDADAEKCSASDIPNPRSGRLA
jgi:hypothetical protein